MASITKRGDGWTVRWREGGTSRRQQAPDLATAKRVQREVERAQALGRRWEPDSGADSLSEALDAYLKDRRRVWRPNTYSNADVSLALFEAWLGRTSRRRVLTVGMLSRQVLAEWWDHVRFERGCSVRTTNLRTAAVQLAWAWLWDSDEYGAATPRPRTIDLPAPDETIPVAPTWAQMDAAIDACGPEHWRRLFVLMRCTGLRVQQARQLLWTDVDLESEILTVRPELGKTRKERRGRRVPLAPVLVAELAGWGVREGTLTGAPQGLEWRIDRTTPVRAWRRAGVPAHVWKGQPTHAFRKGFRTELKAAGVASEAVDYLVGHARPGMAETYDDPRCLALVEAVSMIPALGRWSVRSVSNASNEKR